MLTDLSDIGPILTITPVLNTLWTGSVDGTISVWDTEVWIFSYPNYRPDHFSGADKVIKE